MTALVYAFLFAPILIVILFSFNSARSLQTFDGVVAALVPTSSSPTSRCATSLFTSIEIAAITTVVATALGHRARARA